VTPFEVSLKLPREKVTLVAPPFVHAHEQVAKSGPKIIEFTMTVVEKQVVIDEAGTRLDWAITMGIVGNAEGRG
jgi:nitrite reductase (NO-forming)